MTIIFWITTIISILQGFYIVFCKKDYLNIFSYIFIGVYIPLVLYFLNWSSLIDRGISVNFYMLFVYLNLALIFINAFNAKSLNIRPFRIYLKRGKRAIQIINFLYLSLVLFENYLGSGSLFPALKGIDIHTYAAPGLSYLTDSLYAVLIANFLFFYVTKKKEYLFWIATFLLLPIIGKSSRIKVVVSGLQLLSFGVFIYLNDKKDFNNKMKFFEKKRHKVMLIIVIIISLYSLVSLTEYRMGHYGKYAVSYARSIGYTGPDKFENIGSVYYGYFPLSYNNLNLNIKYRDFHHNYIGLYSYKSLYFGVFRLHNIFDLNPYKPDIGKYVTSGSATVPTGFFDFYYDYGILSFIPIFVGVLIYAIMKKRVQSKSATITSYVLYFFWVPLWTFMSFQNLIYAGPLIIRGVILYIVVNSLFKVELIDS